MSAYGFGIVLGVIIFAIICIVVIVQDRQGDDDGDL